MELCLFSIDDGYAESILRGLRAGFLNEVHYNQMKNCSTLAELKSVEKKKKCSLFKKRKKRWKNNFYELYLSYF
jgi:hypothetical protein